AGGAVVRADHEISAQRATGCRIHQRPGKILARQRTGARGNLPGVAYQSASGSVRLAGLGVLAGVFDDHAGALLRDLLVAHGGEGLWCDQHAERPVELVALGHGRADAALDPAISARASQRSHRYGADRAVWRDGFPDVDDAAGELDALCRIRARYALHLVDVSLLLVSAVADLQ